MHNTQLTPHVLCYHLARGLIGFFRTVPDLVWAIFFVATVGLGPFAGTLTIIVDTIGFCGRFFAEAMEEVDPGPQEALAALGAGRASVVFCAVVPAAMPSFINSALFSLEKAVRSSVILGIVGPGGIGIELKVAMDMFRVLAGRDHYSGLVRPGPLRRAHERMAPAPGDLNPFSVRWIPASVRFLAEPAR